LSASGGRAHADREPALDFDDDARGVRVGDGDAGYLLKRGTIVAQTILLAVGIISCALAMSAIVLLTFAANRDVD
jgi:hypothetical protein